MYIAVLLILAGWAIGFRSWPITLYAFIVMIAFHLRVVLHEEPWLARTFGEVWPPYRQRVSRPPADDEGFTIARHERA